MQRWEGIKSLTSSSSIGNAKSAHKNARWKCSGTDTKPALLLHQERVSAQVLFAAMSAQLRPPAVLITRVIFRAASSPPGQWEPLLYPTSGDPLSLASHHAGTAGKAQKGARDRLPAGARQSPRGTPGTAPQLGGIRLG